MSIMHYAKSRYSTKVFDPSNRLSHEQIASIKELLRFSPSSVNSQPWHFIIAESPHAKQRIAKATQGRYAFNEAKVLNASHVLIFCTKTDIDDAYLQLLLENEARDGRSYFVNLHRDDLKDVHHWMEKQVYLNLGTVLLGASALGIDAVPMEGFDAEVLDEEFELKEKGYRSSVILPLGLRSAQDFNAKLPKSRHQESYLFSEF